MPATTTASKYIKQLIRLPKAQRLKIANSLYKTIPEEGEGISMAELEKRVKAVDNGTARLVSRKEFFAPLKASVNKRG